MISTPVGSGITLERSPQSLEPVLNQVIAELRTSSLERKIATNFDLTQAVNCDGGRIAQLFSNLLGNSISHGTAARPIQVQARTHDGAFELSVANSGQPIPAEAMDRLFQPFYRVSAQEAPQGWDWDSTSPRKSRAHGGKIDVTSSPQETRFTFRMPLSDTAD